MNIQNRERFFDKIREKYPDWKWLKKSFAQIRVRRLFQFMLDPAIVTGAENSMETKRQAVQSCKEKWESNYRYFEKAAKEIISRAPRYQKLPDTADLITDMLFCHFAYGFTPDEYLCYDLEQRTAAERKEFVSHLERFRYVYQMNDIKEVQQFNNKSKTCDKYRQYYKRDCVSVRGPEDKEALQRFLAAHPVFVKKDVYGSMGAGIERVDFSEGAPDIDTVISTFTKKTPVLLEELIVQHPVTAALHPSSVNTVRVITFNTKHGIVVPYCFMKVGRGSSFVDNGGAGGILVGISNETGMLNTNGVDELNIRYDVHPDTKITFNGYQLPNWNEAIRICKEMSAKESRVKFIGWDLACTENGWVVVEGNGMSQLIGPQTINCKGEKSRVLQIMADMDLIL